jgi:SAM-dependent methyltransferase
MNPTYIHGSSAVERARLALMNDLINDRCLQALGLAAERKILDVGCGTGQFTRLMAATLPATARIVAVERDPAQLEAAREVSEGGPAGCAIEFRPGDALALPLQSHERSSFDLAHARYLLEHVTDPAAAVRHMVDAVRPGGRIVLLDDDHELFRCWPEPPGLATAWRAFFSAYRRLGCDPLVGRKLVALLHGAGARPTRVTQLFYGACHGEEAFAAMIDNLLGQLRGARETVLAAGEIGAGDYDAALHEFARFRSREDGALWYVINWAEGHRPESPQPP